MKKLDYVISVWKERKLIKKAAILLNNWLYSWNWCSWSRWVKPHICKRCCTHQKNVVPVEVSSQLVMMSQHEAVSCWQRSLTLTHIQQWHVIYCGGHISLAHLYHCCSSSNSKSSSRASKSTTSTTILSECLEQNRMVRWHMVMSTIQSEALIPE